jgi:hypothetical protein
MRPAVSWMSVKDERRALQEIRSMKEALQQEALATEARDATAADEIAIQLMLEKATDKLESVDMTMEEFALHYVSGHSQKRGQGSAAIQAKARSELAAASFPSMSQSF